MPEIRPTIPEPGLPPRRVRLTAHSTAISNVVLVGYARLSDGARLTYMVLESYDWPDKDGFSKGRCWPSIETIATARGKSYDTVARHLKELEVAGLIRVESGQERGVANCYWLLGPSDQEAASYKERLDERSMETAPQEPAQTAAVETAGPGPQPCPTPSGKHAPPSPAILREEEHEREESRFKKFELEKDSNLFSSRMDKGHPRNQFRNQPNGEDTSPNRPGSAYIGQIILDFSRALNDLSHAPSNQKQAQNLFRQSGLAEKAFVELLYEAKKRTQWAAIATPSVTGAGPNRAAYFFKVVRNLLEEKAHLSAHPPARLSLTP
jgi:DNA-binding MarR family transcriptional regulator